MDHAAPAPVLRLVRENDAAHVAPAHLQRLAAGRPTNARSITRAVKRVEAENKRATKLSDDDVRRIFAARVAENIDGGRAAIVTAERRRRLMRIAQTLGIRPFDASLVIAIAQDAARRGKGAPAIGKDARLAHVAAPRRARRGGRRGRGGRRAVVFAAAVILALAGAMFAALIVWVRG